MGQHGPPATPTSINVLRGNPSRRPLNLQEPKSRRVLPPGMKPEGNGDISASRFLPPDHLEQMAKDEWKRLVPILARMKVLTEADRPLLQNICMLHATIVKSDNMLQELEKMDKTAGLLYKSASGYIQQQPLIGIRNNAMAEHSKLLQQFGMTPASRARIVTGDDGKPKQTGVLNGEWRKSG